MHPTYLLVATTALAITAGCSPSPTASRSTAGTHTASSRDSALEARLDRVIAQAIDEHRIVGAVVIVAHRGTIVYREAHGLADREARRPMRVDTVHRLASLTKPLVGVAVLRLAEQGRLELDAPVTRWLPEFRPKLADGTRPTITLRQLLSHTAGLGYRFGEPPDGPYHRLGVSDGLDASGITLDDNLGRLAAAPLLAAPGTAWNYSLSYDVLGRVIEKVTRQDLETALRALVTGPLAMADTSFLAAHPERLATPYADGASEPVRMTGLHQQPFGASTVDFSPSRATDKTAYYSGGGGMVGTADDYIRFLEALRAGGAPLVSSSTAAQLGENAIGELQTFRGPGWGFGLIGAVLVDPAAAGEPGNAGSFDWGGAYGHSWWVDPSAEISVVALTNTAFEGMNGRFPRDLKAAVYEALR